MPRNDMTMQEIFDTVVTHLRQQGCKSINSNKMGKYRNTDGLKCAAGVLIPDAIYVPEMEGILWKDLIYLYDVGFKDFKSNELVSMLQLVHDHRSLKYWETEFYYLARVNNLNYTPPAP